MITIGNNGEELTIVVPRSGERNTTKSMRENTYQKISDHNHRGNGSGAKLKGDLAFDFSEAFLLNNSGVISKYTTGSDRDLIKVTSADKLSFSLDFYEPTTFIDITSDLVSLLSRENSGTVTIADLMETTYDTEKYAHQRLTGAAATAYTMSDGSPGDIRIYAHTGAGTITITPDTFANGTTITMNDEDQIMLIWSSTGGWRILGGPSYSTTTPIIS